MSVQPKPRPVAVEAKRPQAQTAFILPKPAAGPPSANFANLQVMYPNQIAESPKVRFCRQLGCYFLCCGCDTHIFQTKLDILITYQMFFVRLEISENVIFYSFKIKPRHLFVLCTYKVKVGLQLTG